MISVMQRATVRGLVWPSTIRRRAARLVSALRIEPAELAVVLTDDIEIRELNRVWRHKDAPTDVLSFPQTEGPMAPTMPGMPVVLGDVVISLETAGRQAAEPGCLPRLWPCLGLGDAPPWSIVDEVTFLLLHGVLHLLGLDHQTPDEAAEMEARESALLPALLGRGRSRKS